MYFKTAHWAWLCGNKNGSFAYDPQHAFDNLAGGETATDWFRYTVSDGEGGSDTATVTITIVGNDAPLAADDVYDTDEDTPLHVISPGLLANDTDPDTGDVLTVGSVDTKETRGTVAWHVDGSFTYNPNGMFDDLPFGDTATDTFTYAASDDHGGSNTANVTITVSGRNDDPVATDDAYVTDEDASLDVTLDLGLLINDADLDTGDVLTVSSVETSATRGMVTWNASGEFTYNPNGMFDDLLFRDTATDTFTYTASDGHGGSNTASVLITINGQNDFPQASDDDVHHGRGYTVDCGSWGRPVEQRRRSRYR